MVDNTSGISEKKTSSASIVTRKNLKYSSIVSSKDRLNFLSYNLDNNKLDIRDAVEYLLYLESYGSNSINREQNKKRFDAVINKSDSDDSLNLNSNISTEIPEPNMLEKITLSEWELVFQKAINRQVEFIKENNAYSKVLEENINQIYKILKEKNTNLLYPQFDKLVLNNGSSDDSYVNSYIKNEYSSNPIFDLNEEVLVDALSNLPDFKPFYESKNLPSEKKAVNAGINSSSVYYKRDYLMSKVVYIDCDPVDVSAKPVPLRRIKHKKNRRNHLPVAQSTPSLFKNLYDVVIINADMPNKGICVSSRGIEYSRLSDYDALKEELSSLNNPRV